MDKIKREALIYLGYKNKTPDAKTEKVLEECILEISNLNSAKYIYRIYDISQTDENVVFEGTTLKFKSKDFSKHISSSKKAAIICATLGAQVDFLINKYNKTDIFRALVFDACASAYIEDVCDRAQDEIFEIAEKEGYKITPRFSPGYGDMPINLQSKIIKITNAQKLINLTATSDCVLIPTKSVTAFLGFTKENITSCTNKCLLCNFRDKCNFRR